MTVIKFAELKVGDEIPVDAVLDEVWLPLYGVEGENQWIRITNVPVEALWG